MARRRRPTVTYENRAEQVKQKIEDAPKNALREIGKFLAKEIKLEAAKSKKTRIYYKDGKKITVKPGRLKKGIGYKLFKKENKVQVGSKSWYALWEEKGSSKNAARPFFMPTVRKNVELIQNMLKDAYRRLNN